MSENNLTEEKKENKVDRDSTAKRCPHCKKKLKMYVVKHSQDENKISTFLLKFFSPGGVQINQRYKCPRCSHEFDDMTFGEAAVVPMILIGVVILSVVLFLGFVFSVVAK